MTTTNTSDVATQDTSTPSTNVNKDAAPVIIFKKGISDTYVPITCNVCRASFSVSSTFRHNPKDGWDKKCPECCASGQSDLTYGSSVTCYDKRSLIIHTPGILVEYKEYKCSACDTEFGVYATLDLKCPCCGGTKVAENGTTTLPIGKCNNTTPARL
jgi:hypothetical protein